MGKSAHALMLLVLASMSDGSSLMHAGSAHERRCYGGGDGGDDGDDDGTATAIDIVSRESWGARPPKAVDEMSNPVPYVIIHHSYIPAACATEDECVMAMREMQRMHQENNGWNDIGYSFAIGGDGNIYEGRGWRRQGAHAPTYNNESIGICMIGDWRAQTPPPSMLARAHELIAYGVRRAHVAAAYALYTHRQVRAGTECPGDALHQEVASWPHWSATPPRKYTPLE